MNRAGGRVGRLDVGEAAAPVDEQAALCRVAVAATLVEEALTYVGQAGHELRDVVHGILPRFLTHGGHGQVLVVEVRDDGVGGADPARGTGPTSLVDRVDAVGGVVTIVSPDGVGTTVRVGLPTRDRVPTGGKAPRPPLDRPPVDAGSGV